MLITPKTSRIQKLSKTCTTFSNQTLFNAHYLEIPFWCNYFRTEEVLNTKWVRENHFSWIKAQMFMKNYFPLNISYFSCTFYLQMSQNILPRINDYIKIMLNSVSLSQLDFTLVREEYFWDKRNKPYSFRVNYCTLERSLRFDILWKYLKSFWVSILQWANDFFKCLLWLS